MELQSLDQQKFQPNVCLGQNKCLRVSALEKRGMVSRHYYLSRLMTKPTKWHVCPAKTQISPGILPVWSESSLSALRNIGSLATHWAHSEDSDQTGRMPRLIRVFDGRTLILFVGFVMRRLILSPPPHRDKNPCIGRVGKPETHMFIFLPYIKSVELVFN